MASENRAHPPGDLGAGIFSTSPSAVSARPVRYHSGNPWPAWAHRASPVVISTIVVAGLEPQQRLHRQIEGPGSASLTSSSSVCKLGKESLDQFASALQRALRRGSPSSHGGAHLRATQSPLRESFMQKELPPPAKFPARLETSLAGRAARDAHGFWTRCSRSGPRYPTAS